GLRRRGHGNLSVDPRRRIDPVGIDVRPRVVGGAEVGRVVGEGGAEPDADARAVPARITPAPAAIAAMAMPAIGGGLRRRRQQHQPGGDKPGQGRNPQRSRHRAHLERYLRRWEDNRTIYREFPGPWRQWLLIQAAIWLTASASTP